MAKFQPILGNISGSVGANTWAHNRGGPFIRRRSVPTNPNTPRQQIARASLSTLAKRWSNLVPDDREGWAAWAALHPRTDSLGNTINITGSQAFLGLNQRLLTNNMDPVDQAPVLLEPVALNLISTEATAPDEFELTFSTSPTSATDMVEVWWNQILTGDRNPVFSQARWVGITGTAATTPATFTLPASMPLGTYTWIWARTVNTEGQASPPLRTYMTAFVPGP